MVARFLYKLVWFSSDTCRYTDNSDTLQLLDGHKPVLGVFPLLDEELKITKGSDDGFAHKLRVQFGSEVKKPKKKHVRFRDGGFKKPTLFTISHFAGDVTYEAKGFMNKNKDFLSVLVCEVMKASGDGVVAKLFEKARIATIRWLAQGTRHIFLSSDSDRS